MEYEICPIEDLRKEPDFVVLPVFEGEQDVIGELKEIYPRYTYSSLTFIQAKEDFKGKKETHCLAYCDVPTVPDRILLWGLGKKEEFDLLAHKEEMERLIKFIRRLGARTAAIKVFGDPADSQRVRATIEGLILGSYEFKKYKTEKKEEEEEDKLKLIKILAEINDETAKAFRTGRILAENTNLARDLINEPPNKKRPVDFVVRSKEIVFDSGGKLKISVLKDSLSSLGLNLLTAVARGSVNPPYLLMVGYKPENCKNPDRPFVFVGKGLCYDSGGLNIKPEDYMNNMKMDMAGAGAVLFAIKAIAELELPFWVVGFMPVLENMPSGSAYKADDIIRAYNGRNVEIVNTDAEGRLVLYDVLAYIQDYFKDTKPKLLLDLATLTGACVTALGYTRAGIMGNNQEFIDKLVLAGERSSELLWQLPMDKSYEKALESKVADIKHLQLKRDAGTIVGACFLKDAIKQGQPWAHIDCAGPAMPEDGLASGFGVRLLVQLLLDAESE